MSVCHKIKKYPIANTLKIGQRILRAECLDAVQLCTDDYALGLLGSMTLNFIQKHQKKFFNFILKKFEKMFLLLCIKFLGPKSPGDA